MYNEEDKNGKIYLNLLKDYIKLKKLFTSHYEYYNILEKQIVGISLSKKEEEYMKPLEKDIYAIIHKIK